MPDAHFADPRLARLYDPLAADRRDLDAYVAMVDEFGATSVLDVGCGTGTLACLLAARGIDVVAVDPAAASLDVARAKPHAEKVRWVHGAATALPRLQVDVATMTGNVAQVFLDDGEWRATLGAIHAALRPGGCFVFESRNPEARAWLRWTEAATRAHTELPGGDSVETWIDRLEVRWPFVSFRSNFRLRGAATPLVSESTLRFRSREELEASLQRAGLEVAEVRDAPDRPGLELVFVARRPVPWTAGGARP